jgi:hypothetical protein
MAKDARSEFVRRRDSARSRRRQNFHCTKILPAE